MPWLSRKTLDGRRVLKIVAHPKYDGSEGGEPLNKYGGRMMVSIKEPPKRILRVDLLTFVSYLQYWKNRKRIYQLSA